MLPNWSRAVTAVSWTASASFGVSVGALTVTEATVPGAIVSVSEPETPPALAVTTTLPGTNA